MSRESGLLEEKREKNQKRRGTGLPVPLLDTDSYHEARYLLLCGGLGLLLLGLLGHLPSWPRPSWARPSWRPSSRASSRPSWARPSWRPSWARPSCRQPSSREPERPSLLGLCGRSGLGEAQTRRRHHEHHGKQDCENLLHLLSPPSGVFGADTLQGPCQKPHDTYNQYNQELKITHQRFFEWNLHLQEPSYYFWKVKTNLGMMLHYLEGALHI